MVLISSTFLLEPNFLISVALKLHAALSTAIALQFFCIKDRERKKNEQKMFSTQKMISNPQLLQRFGTSNITINLPKNVNCVPTVSSNSPSRIVPSGRWRSGVAVSSPC